ncbi:MAG: MFS transporter [Microbacteriaceae bacterium]|nr:MFS transporter [Microbacteriaceae bacterium]
MGLLPQISASLLPVLDQQDHEEAIAQTGWLIAVYALGVVVGAPAIAAFGARVPRKALLASLLAVFTLSTIASALLPTFGLVLAARFVAGLPHGAYFGIAMLTAARLLGPRRRALGVSLIMTGLTIANVVGVPLITLLGQQAGWRTAYLAVAAVFALSTVCVIAVVPRIPADEGASVRRELGVFRRPQVWITLAIGAIGFGGFFAVYSYMADVVVRVTQLPQEATPWALSTIGLGMFCGNLLGGRLADRSVMGTVFGGFVALAAALGLFFLLAPNAVGVFVGAFVVGFAALVINPAVQTRLMDVAGDGQSLAAASNHSSFNLGNSLGAYLGGLAIASGLGYTSPALVGIVLIVPAAVLAVVSVRLGGVRHVHQDAVAGSETI